ncbi:MAG: RHS repeat-associated core domain-containing protein [Sphingobacteriales bacterium JAD_PAG50586_3]|nr:MAG: RHS repeat-associated core domain-containing protein [Sphingobacteriales bacterium JAD_PAG50586_3]
MQNRSETPEDYRFGFNGKEYDKQTSTQDYGFRIYNPSLARFLSVDPLADDYPFYTPYQFAGNNPIQYIDLDGKEPTLPATPSFFNFSITIKTTIQEIKKLLIRFFTLTVLLKILKMKNLNLK